LETIGLIPCAGKGTRLGMPFSKEMFPDVRHTSYRPIITYTIEAMKKAGIRHIIVTVNPYKTDLMKFLGNGHQFGINLTYCMHPEAKSLPESLNEAYHLIKNKRVVFAMPDTIIQPHDFIKSALEYHKEETNSEVTLGCFRTENPTSVSVVEFNGNRITNVIEKPNETHLEWMWGMMVWEPTFANDLNEFCLNMKPKDGVKELYLSDSLHKLIRKNKVYAYKSEVGKYRDLGTFSEIIEWGKEWDNKKEKTSSPTEHLLEV
jgi:glucose-1-phosphate thymidylyltransferase